MKSDDKRRPVFPIVDDGALEGLKKRAGFGANSQRRAEGQRYRTSDRDYAQARPEGQAHSREEYER